MSLFSKETVQTASHPQDIQRLQELDTQHQLLKTEKNTPVTTFDQVRILGEFFIEEKGKLTTNLLDTSKNQRAQNMRLLAEYVARKEGSFLGSLAYPGLSERFALTATPLLRPDGKGYDLQLQVLPVPFSALEKSQHGSSTDSMLALAAAVTVAPQFVLALEGGVATTQCSTKKNIVTSITPDHGLPLATLFDSFTPNPTNTLAVVQRITGNRDITYGEAAHFHGQSVHEITLGKVSGFSGVAGGFPIQTLLASELPSGCGLLVNVASDQGNEQITSLNRALARTIRNWSNRADKKVSAQLLSQIGIDVDMSEMAAALAITGKVVGDDQRERKIATAFSSTTADTPLRLGIK